LLAAAVQSFTTALSQQYRSEDAPKPALGEFQSLPASGDTAQAAERAQPEKESDKSVSSFGSGATRRTRARRLNSRSAANNNKQQKGRERNVQLLGRSDFGAEFVL
jgi:hypothetical protein